MASDSRASMVRSAALLIAARGLNGTSLSDVVDESGAPRGSIYHHFPGGKEQLAAEAVKWTADGVLAYQARCPATTPREVLAWFVDLWRRVVVSSATSGGCAVAGVAVDTDAPAGLLVAARDTFRSWVALLAQQLQATGLAPARATAVATTALAAMEGALILCRVERSVEPLDAIAGQLQALLVR